MERLELRKQLILRAVVRQYVETAEPVGSAAIATRYNFGVKSATLRNEMAEMAEMGYLKQPHTSAGRVPSDKGYRYYVDWLIEPRGLSSAQRAFLRSQLEKTRAEIEQVLQQTCRMLSALTHYVSMATPPGVPQDVVRHIHLAAMDRNRLLVVVALDTGRVEHAVLHCGVDLMSVDLARIEHLVSTALCGRTVSQATQVALHPTEALPAEESSIYKAVMESVGKTMASIQEEESVEVYVEGTGEVLRQPEFRHSEAVRHLISLLEERRQLFSLLRDVYSHQVQVMIGSECADPRMSMCSLVAARYQVLGRYAGTIGVLGPTRMDYDRTVPTVRTIAQWLGRALTRVSL